MAKYNIDGSPVRVEDYRKLPAAFRPSKKMDFKAFMEYARRWEFYSVNELGLIEYYLKLGNKSRARDLLQYGFNERPDTGLVYAHYGQLELSNNDDLDSMDKKTLDLLLESI